MLINGGRQQRVPDGLDKSLETKENCRSRKKFEDRHMLTNILNS